MSQKREKVPGGRMRASAIFFYLTTFRISLNFLPFST